MLSIVDALPVGEVLLELARTPLLWAAAVVVVLVEVCWVTPLRLPLTHAGVTAALVALLAGAVSRVVG
jgi:hypothetical protein